MSRKRTLQEVYDFFKEQGYELLSTEYENAHQKLQYKCPEGHIHEITWNNFQRGRRCPDCANDKLRQERRHDEKKVIEAFEKEGYTIVGKYFNSRTPIEYICPQGHKHECSYDNWKKGNRCPECCRNIWSLEKAKEYLSQFGYELLEEQYISSSTLMKMKCPKGHIIYKAMSNFYAGHRCGCCKNHQHEEAIEEILNRYNIEFLREYRFLDCKDERTLPFDFYIPNLNTCIEYDGEQHFKPVDFGRKGEEHAEKSFKTQQKRDKIKTEYCKNNNIKLIRIPYWEFDNAENILKQELNIL